MCQCTCGGGARWSVLRQAGRPFVDGFVRAIAQSVCVDFPGTATRPKPPSA
ncbi:hypothetical protein DF3PA_50071 [Candidatus Defluviicoccus seviourii]|uniref:Uncharacterized protein n=1 Tax=Candidatus Defluviicoccus seviourii TaxID=2565273 RepID=A0A564WIN7_9PROT|nr:hypothetical protein DF3PA_50071 [Candidatus Defluviicoccus seviourii]